jgi:proline dehydrogenase
VKGGAAWRLLRDTRYALPGALGRVIPAPDAPHAVAIARQQARAGAATTIGYFEGAGGGSLVDHGRLCAGGTAGARP